MRPSPLAVATILLPLLLGSARAAEIKVMYPPPLRTVLSELIPQFERESGHKRVPAPPERLTGVSTVCRPQAAASTLPRPTA